jgi:hypothetical protein
MRNILLTTFLIVNILFILCTIPSHSFAGVDKESKEYTFAYNLLQTLHYCEWAMDYYPKESDDIPKMMTNTMTQNNKFGFGKSFLEKYLNDNDTTIKTVAKGVTSGIDLLVLSNNNFLKRLRKITNMDKESLKDIYYESAQIASDRKQAWEVLFMSATGVFYVLTEPAKSENPKGAIPYKITNEERKSLLKEIDRLFGDALKKYYKYREARNKGLQGNPDDQTYVIFAIDNIKKNISFKTYEEASKNTENK